MSSYIFGSSTTKSDNARNLVKQYTKNREIFINKAIQIVINATDNQICEVALGFGKTKLRVDVETVVKKNPEIKTLTEELKLKDTKLRPEEKKLIIQALVHYFEDQKFNVETSYNNVVDIEWV